MRLLSGDIGGTKTLLRIVEDRGGRHVEREERFDSHAFRSFEELAARFLNGDAAISAATFAVAGPVLDGEASITNLPWIMRERELEQRLAIPCVRLVNDFFAVARGVPLLQDDDVVMLNRGSHDPAQPVAILGAGTGLGEAILLPEHDGWRVVPSEGGHADFAPTNDEQLELLRFLRVRHEHVSYERVVSGIGITGVYEYVLSTVGCTLPENVEDIPAFVSKQAAAGDALAQRAFGIFVDAYAAEASNLALKVLARGGVYLAGGIAAKNIPQFTNGRFMQSFARKGRFASLVHHFPVFVITNAQVGLHGATAIAEEIARRRGAGRTS